MVYALQQLERFVSLDRATAARAVATAATAAATVDAADAALARSNRGRPPVATDAAMLACLREFYAQRIARGRFSVSAAYNAETHTHQIVPFDRSFCLADLMAPPTVRGSPYSSAVSVCDSAIDIVTSLMPVFDERRCVDSASTCAVFNAIIATRIRQGAAAK